jgi:hypothetical protein
MLRASESGSQWHAVGTLSRGCWARDSLCVVEQGTLGGLKARGVLRLECLVSEIEDCVEEADE